MAARSPAPNGRATRESGSQPMTGPDAGVGAGTGAGAGHPGAGAYPPPLVSSADASPVVRLAVPQAASLAPSVVSPIPVVPAVAVQESSSDGTMPSSPAQSLASRRLTRPVRSAGSSQAGPHADPVKNSALTSTAVADQSRGRLFFSSDSGSMPAMRRYIAGISLFLFMFFSLSQHRLLAGPAAIGSSLAGALFHRHHLFARRELPCREQATRLYWFERDSRGDHLFAARSFCDAFIASAQAAPMCAARWRAFAASQRGR
jgi:hypothetical protein